MNISFLLKIIHVGAIFPIILCLQLRASFSNSNHRILTKEGFIKTINNNDFLIAEKMTTNDEPLDTDELVAIEYSLKNNVPHFGGIFFPGREIDTFTGDTLVVGGGRKAGSYEQNQGIAVLIDYEAEIKLIKSLIQKLRSGEWSRNPYTGEEFESDSEKEQYITKLERKIILYRDAFREKNNDIMRKYYTLNIEEDVQPDILASITSLADVEKIPDHKFNHVVLENLPCDVYLNSNLYTNLERITKPGGTVTFAVGYDCRRLIIPVITHTNFGKEFIKKIKEEMYSRLNILKEKSGNCYIKVTVPTRCEEHHYLRNAS